MLLDIVLRRDAGLAAPGSPSSPAAAPALATTYGWRLSPAARCCLSPPLGRIRLAFAPGRPVHRAAMALAPLCRRAARGTVGCRRICPATGRCLFPARAKRRCRDLLAGLALAIFGSDAATGRQRRSSVELPFASAAPTGRSGSRELTPPACSGYGARHLLPPSGRWPRSACVPMAMNLPYRRRELPAELTSSSPRASRGSILCLSGRAAAAERTRSWRDTGCFGGWSLAAMRRPSVRARRSSGPGRSALLTMPGRRAERRCWALGATHGLVPAVRARGRWLAWRCSSARDHLAASGRSLRSVHPGAGYFPVSTIREWRAGPAAYEARRAPPPLCPRPRPDSGISAGLQALFARVARLW